MRAMGLCHAGQGMGLQSSSGVARSKVADGIIPGEPGLDIAGAPLNASVMGPLLMLPFRVPRAHGWPTPNSTSSHQKGDSEYHRVVEGKSRVNNTCKPRGISPRPDDSRIQISGEYRDMMTITYTFQDASSKCAKRTVPESFRARKQL